MPLDESRAALARPGQPVEVLFDGPGETAGPLALRASGMRRLESASHGFLVRIDLPDSVAWRSGLFGRARFAGAERRTLAIPDAAVVRRGQLTLVFAIEDGRARLRPISIGAVVGGRVEVLAGLRDGDRVIAAPGVTLEDGAPVSGGGQ